MERRDTVMHVEGKARRVLTLASFTVSNAPTRASPRVPRCARHWGRPRRRGKFSSGARSWPADGEWRSDCSQLCVDVQPARQDLAPIRTSIWLKLQATQAYVSEEMNVDMVQWQQDHWYRNGLFNNYDIWAKCLDFDSDRSQDCGSRRPERAEHRLWLGLWSLPGRERWRPCVSDSAPLC